MKEIAQALVKAQSEMGDAVKDAKNPFFKSKFADLNSVREATIPVLNKYGISVLQPTVYQDGQQFVKTVLLHVSGESLEAMTMVLVKEANNPQMAGSGISYARRYGLQSFLCVGAVEDDGELAMGRGAVASKPVVKTETFATSAGPVEVKSTMDDQGNVLYSAPTKAAPPKFAVKPKTAVVNDGI